MMRYTDLVPGHLRPRTSEPHASIVQYGSESFSNSATEAAAKGMKRVQPEGLDSDDEDLLGVDGTGGDELRANSSQDSASGSDSSTDSDLDASDCDSMADSSTNVDFSNSYFLD